MIEDTRIQAALTDEQMDDGVFAYTLGLEAMAKGVTSEGLIKILAEDKEEEKELCAKMNRGYEVLCGHLCLISPETTQQKPSPMVNRYAMDAGLEFGEQAWRLVFFTRMTVIDSGI